MALSSVEELDGFATPSPYSTSATGSDIWDDVSVNRPQDDPVVIVGIGEIALYETCFADMLIRL